DDPNRRLGQVDRDRGHAEPTKLGAHRGRAAAPDDDRDARERLAEAARRVRGPARAPALVECAEWPVVVVHLREGAEVDELPELDDRRVETDEERIAAAPGDVERRDHLALRAPVARPDSEKRSRTQLLEERGQPGAPRDPLGPRGS